ncbi:MAG: hypothetical protein VB032_02175 [Burkholderiaceae bacterium]|nr:hypothetical protein [Burkholderiaceae bacterium]
MSDHDVASDDSTEVKPTAPNGFNICVKGISDEVHATQFGQRVGAFVVELSRYFDLGQLDALTIAHDYPQALLDLDRGYVTSHKLTPSNNDAVGVGMAPAVMRDGQLKSHLVLNAAFILPIEDEEHEYFSLAFHILAHECAHVEATNRFNSAFPGILLQLPLPAHAAYRYDVILACWDEYIACRLCAGFGRDPTDDYESTFLERLIDVRQQANQCIIDYRIHRNIDQVLGDMYRIYGGLMKITSYHLGNLSGRDLSPADMQRTADALYGHWYAGFFDRLRTALEDIADQYGAWTDFAAFDVIGDLVDELIADGGVYITPNSDGSMHVNIPYTPETMPLE